MNAFPVVVLWMMMAIAFLGGLGSRSARAQQSSGAGQSAEKLPPDIRPDSLSRMPRAKREDFTTEEEKQIYDRLAILSPQIKDKEGWLGPTGTRVHIPKVAEMTRNLDIAIKENNGVEPKYQELAILIATREFNDEWEFMVHASERGHYDGIHELPKDANLFTPKLVDVVRNNLDTKGLEEKDALLIQFGREMFRQPKVSSKTFAEMERTFGRKGTLGLSLVMSYYALNGLLMRVYDQHLDPSKKSPFPDLAAGK
jgi:4-carboxymuconolactone decarboxylase